MTDVAVRHVEPNDLIKAHLNLAKEWARIEIAKCPPHIRFTDVHRSALFGLVKAAHSYDPTRGVPFGGYAHFRIQGQILDDQRAQDPAEMARRVARHAGREHAPNATLSFEWVTEQGDDLRDAADVEQDVLDNEEIHRLYAAIGRLTGRHRQVIELCCLHRGVQQTTLAGRWGVTQSRISQIRAEAIRALAKDPDLIEVPR